MTAFLFLLLAAADQSTDDHGDDAATATPIDVGSSIDGEIETGDDHDFFRIHAEEGRTYTMYCTHRGINDSYLELYGEDPVNRLAYDDDSGGGLQPRMQWLCPTTGYYYVKVRPYSPSNSGGYTLFVEESDTQSDTDDIGHIPGQASPLALGATATSTIDIEGDADMFAVELEANQTVTISVQPGALRDSTLTLYEDDGVTQLQYNDDDGGGLGSRIVYTAPAAGTYYAVVRRFGDSGTGDYTISVDEGDVAPVNPPVIIQPVNPPVPGDDHGNEFWTASYLQAGGGSTGVVDSETDQDWFQFNAVPGSQYTITVDVGDGGLDSEVSVYDTDGFTMIASNDDGEGMGLGSLVTVTTQNRGTVYVCVRPHGASAGDYWVMLEEMVPETLATVDDFPDAFDEAPILSFGGAVPGSIFRPGDLDCFRFEPAAGTRYTITVSLDSLRDSVVDLCRADGTLLASNDDGEGLGHGSRIEWTAPEAGGPAFIRVRAFSEAQRGAYAIELAGGSGDDHADEADGATGMATDRSLPGVLGEDDADWFVHVPAEGGRRTATVILGTLPSATVTVQDASGVAIESSDEQDDNPAVTWEAEAGATYRIRVHSGTGRAGSYAIRLSGRPMVPVREGDDHSDTFDGATPITPGEALEGNIDSGQDGDWFSFEAEVGTLYVIDVHLNSLTDSVVELYGSDGRSLIDRNDDFEGGLASHLEWTATSAGTFYIRVVPFSENHTGSYTLDIWPER